jgi:hypothetical protein
MFAPTGYGAVQRAGREAVKGIQKFFGGSSSKTSRSNPVSFADVIDASFLDDLERAGFIRELDGR